MLLYYLPDRALPPLLLLAGELLSYRCATDTQGDLIAALSLLSKGGKSRVNLKSCTHVKV
jgi:hypothetical protein